MTEANVSVVISAITEQAEEAIESVGDDMSGLADDATVGSAGLDRLSANMGEGTRAAGILQAALGELQDAERDTTVSSRLLSQALDSVAENENQVARNAVPATGAITSLGVSSEGAGFSVSFLSTALQLSLIPSLLTVSTILAPLVATIGAFAAVVGSVAASFGGLIAVGAVTHMEELKAAFKESAKEINTLIQPLGEVFGPLLVQAVQALPDLVEAMLAAIGPVDQFRDTLVEFGEIAMEVIPAVVGTMFRLAREALPAVRSFVDYLVNNGGAAFATMMEAARGFTPELMALLSAFGDMLPVLLEFGNATANIVLPALTSLVNMGTRVMSFVNGLSAGMRDLALKTAIAAPALVKITSALLSLSNPVTAAIAAVGALAGAYHTNFGGMREAVNQYAGVVSGIIAENRDKFQALAATAGDMADGFRDAFGTVEAIVRGVLFSAVLPMVEQALGAVRDNMGPFLAEINQTLQALMGYAHAFGQTFNSFWEDWGDEIVATTRFVFGLIGTVVGAAMEVLMNVLMAAMNVIQGDWEAAGQNLLDAFVDPAETLLQFFQSWGIISAIRSAINGAVRYVRDGVRDMLATVNRTLRPITRTFAAAWDTVTTTVSTALAFLTGLVRTGLVNMLDVIINVLQAVAAFIKGDFDKAAKQLFHAFADPLERTLKFLRSWGVITTIQTVVSNAVATAENLISGVSTAWGDMVAAVNTTLEEWTLEKIINTAVSGAKDVWDDFTTAMITGVISALANVMGTLASWGPQVHNFFVGLWNGVLSTTEQLLNGFLQTAVDFLNEFLSTVEDVANTVENVTGENILGGVGELTAPQVSASGFEAERRDAVSASRAAANAEEEIALALDINLRGEGEVTDAMASESDATVEEKNTRRALSIRRQTTGGS